MKRSISPGALVWLLLIILFCNVRTLGQWKAIHPLSPINHSFASLQVPGGNKIYAIGYDLAISDDHGEHWTLADDFNLPSLPPNASYWDITFTNEVTGYLINQNKIYKTQDRGKSWNLILETRTNVPAYHESGFFSSIFFSDENHGYAVGPFNKIFKTINGGTTWSMLSWDNSLEPYRNISDVYFVDNNIGFVSGVEADEYWMSFGRKEFVMKTTDGGLTWKQVDLPTSYDFYTVNIQFLNHDVGFAHLTKSDFTDETYCTMDGGTTWTRNSNATLENISAAYWVNHRTGFLFGTNYNTTHSLLVTRNGGKDWTEVSIPVFGQTNVNAITNIRFTNELQGYAVGAGGSILTTRDGGATWREANTGYPHFYDFDFLRDQKTGYAISDYGLFTSANGGRTWQFVKDSENIEILDMVVGQDDYVYLVGRMNKIYKISDGKIDRLTIPANYTYKAYLLERNGALYLCGTDNTANRNFLISSADGGVTWTTLDVPQSDQIVDFDQTTDNLYITFTQRIIQSGDDGTSWKTISSVPKSYFHAITLIDEANIVASTIDNDLFKTANGGASWHPVAIPTGAPYAIHEILKINAQKLYACGYAENENSTDGKIWVSYDGGATWQEELTIPRMTSTLPHTAGFLHIQKVDNMVLATGGYGLFYEKQESDKRYQYIVFDKLAPRLFHEGDFTLDASATSMLPVRYSSSNHAVATIENDRVHLTGIGQTIITASQEGDDLYEPAASVARRLTVKSITAVTDEDVQIELYPNPAKDYIIFKYSKSQRPDTIKIYNVQGQQIGNNTALEKNENETTLINVQWLPNGAYFLSIDDQYKIKFLVSH